MRLCLKILKLEYKNKDMNNLIYIELPDCLMISTWCWCVWQIAQYNVTTHILWHNTHGLRLQPWLVSLLTQLSLQSPPQRSRLLPSPPVSVFFFSCWLPVWISTSWLLPSSVIDLWHFRLDSLLPPYHLSIFPLLLNSFL